MDNVYSVIGQYSLIRVLQGCTGHQVERYGPGPYSSMAGRDVGGLCYEAGSYGADTAYNEEDYISGTIFGVRASGSADRIIVVDDGSTDDTAVVAARSGAEVLRIEGNRKGCAKLRAAADKKRHSGIYRCRCRPN